MKTLLKLSKEAIRYKGLYTLAIIATLSLTFVNLAAPGYCPASPELSKTVLPRRV